jgi:hypothetical protein
MALSGNEVARQLALITMSLQWGNTRPSADMAAYDTIERATLIADWPAEFKAELYARTIEHAQFGKSYLGTEEAFRDGLKATQRKFST